MYYLSVGAVFRNESDGIIEWIKHYLHHGVEHFYLVNDNSDDDTVLKIQEYVDKGIITLYHAKEDYYLGRQRNVYNRFLLPHMKQKDTQWLLVIDLDEYVWSPQAVHLGDVLRMGFIKYGQIQVHQLLFGSNGHQAQPESLVKHFTKRENLYRICGKFFLNSDFEFASINVHYADFANPAYMTDASVFTMISYDWFIYNHYNIISVVFSYTTNTFFPIFIYLFFIYVAAHHKPPLVIVTAGSK
jgi:glycosyltransferase involved in cell wall biosynthesis